MTSKTSWAIVAIALLSVVPALAVNPPEATNTLPSRIDATNLLVEIHGSNLTCVGKVETYTMTSREWLPWGNFVSNIWVVTPDGTNVAGGGLIDAFDSVRWDTSGMKTVTVTHNSNAHYSNGTLIVEFNGQTTNLPVNVLKIDIEQAGTNVCWKMSNAALNLTTNSYIDPGNVSWTNNPYGLSNIGVSADFKVFTFSPSNSTPTQYTVMAQSSLLTNCYDTCTVRVIKVDIEQVATNVCVKMTNATLNLTADSYWGPGGVSWTNEPSGLGDIAASADGRVYSFNPSNSTPTSYVIRAWAGALTNCADTATVNVYRIELSPSATNVCWRMTNEVSMEVLNSYTPNGVTWLGTNGLQLVCVSDQKLVFTPTNSTPTNYMVVAAVTGYTNCYDTSTVNVFKIDIEQAATNTCVQMTNASLNLTADSYWGPGGVSWTNEPSGLGDITASADGRVYSFNPSNSTPTSYVIRAWVNDMTNCTDATTVTVLKVDLEASKNLLTLKHERDCNLEVKTVPATGITIDEYRIDIKRTNSATWYILSTNKTMIPWHGNIAGGFHLRGMAKIGGTECYSTNIVIVNQFPTYTQIEGDADVRSETDTEWANTLTDCTNAPANQRRERGFWIQVNTTSNLYQHTTVFTGPWVGPAQGASATPGNAPADIPVDPAPNATGAVYTVACFHTHTPCTYRAANVLRAIGPSGADVTFHNNQKRVGVVYDYTGDALGRIYGGHSEGDATQRYPVGPTRRPLP